MRAIEAAVDTGRYRGEALSGDGAQLQALIDHAPVALAQFDRQMRYLAVSRAWREQYRLGDQELVGRSHYEVFPEIPEQWRDVHRRALAGETLRSERDRFLRADGTLQWLRWEVQAWRTDAGEIGGIVIFTEDITQRCQTEESLLVYGNAFMHSGEPLLISDHANRIIAVNEAFTEATGYTLEEVRGRDPSLLASGLTPEDTYRDLWQKLADTGRWHGELWDRRKNGEIYPKLASISAIRNEGGEITHHIASFRDISEAKAAGDKIVRLAYYDPLTELANRRLLTDRLKHAVQAAARTAEFGAVLYIDLDNFKTINDTLGHEQGDLLLQKSAGRILAVVREGDTVARVGGDEFIVLLEGLGTEQERAALATKTVGDKLLDALARPFSLAGRIVASSASIGISLWRGTPQIDAQDLLKRADLAMYESKKAGRNVLRFFEPAMQVEVERRSRLESRLREALEQEHFVLYYQGRVDAYGRLDAAEALVRWKDAERGIVAPAEFIPVAEDSGLIVALGNWVLRTACRQLKQWGQSAASSHLAISVNVSARQLAEEHFVAQVEGILRETGANPARLELELTEGALLHNVDDVIVKMGQLRRLGVSFALDDFGTGYSSLAYLLRLPLNVLKIDRTFVRELPQDRNAEALARTIVQMGQNLGLAVVAEGVESEDQWSLLARLGCSGYQGFLFAEPVPIEQFEAQMAGPQAA